MDLSKALTPKDTEEVKPGLFIQERAGRRGVINYRQIHPASWNGKINWKNTLLGPNFWKNFLWFVIIIFLAWSYLHDTQSLREFQENVNIHKAEWCAGVPYQDLGGDVNEFNTFTIPDYDEANLSVQLQ